MTGRAPGLHAEAAATDAGRRARRADRRAPAGAHRAPGRQRPRRARGAQGRLAGAPAPRRWRSTPPARAAAGARPAGRRHARHAPTTPRRGGQARSPGRGLLQPALAASPSASSWRPATRSAASMCWASHRRSWPPSDGVVGRLLAEPGQAVEYGQELVEIDPLAVRAAAATDESAARAGVRRPRQPTPDAGGRLMFGRILIANRGEIAAARAARLPQHGHRGRRRLQRGRPRLARRAAGRRGDLRRARRVARSYLSAAAILSAALVTGCDAIHPGLRLPLRGRRVRGDDARPRPHLHRAARRGAGALRLQGRHARAAGRATACPRCPARRACCATTTTPSRRPSASATRCSSSPPRAAAARACAWCARRASCSRPSPSAAPRRAPPSATTRCTSRSGWRRTATSRSRSSSTATATASTSASATARCSAATRRSWRRRPARPSTTPRGIALAEAAVRAVVAAGYENLGTLEFLVDGEGALLLHRDQLPHPGRAPGHGDALGHRPRGRADPHRGRRAARLRPGGRAAARPRHRVPHQRRGRARTTSGRRSGIVERYLPPGRRRACAWTRTSTAATRSRRTTIRCWASSSSGARTATSAIARVAGRARGAGRGRAGDQHPVPPGPPRGPDLPGRRVHTNLLDRVGAAAFLDAAAGAAEPELARLRGDHDRRRRADQPTPPAACCSARPRSSGSSRIAGRSCSSTASSRRTASAATSGARRPSPPASGSSRATSRGCR